MIDWNTRLRLSLTASENRKITILEKQQERVRKQQALAREKFESLDTLVDQLGRKISDIKSRALDRYERKCPHTNIVGPTTCSRDDCSGNHYHCTDCKKSGFSYEDIKK